MLFKVILCKCFSLFAKTFLHCGVDSQLFTDGMTGEDPGEHISPFNLVVGGAA